MSTLKADCYCMVKLQRPRASISAEVQGLVTRKRSRVDAEPTAGSICGNSCIAHQEVPKWEKTMTKVIASTETQIDSVACPLLLPPSASAF